MHGTDCDDCGPRSYLPPSLPPSPPPSPPSPSPPPPSLPPPPPSSPPPWVVDGEGCEVDPVDAGCVRSVSIIHKKRSAYGNNKECTIAYPPAVPISVTSFAVEADASCQYDYLTVNGARYCGTEGPASVVPDGSPIKWHTDESETEAGWKICFSTVAPHDI
eukprot:scaffold73728_cov57-Phaeocystis_antarctica.AAC.1